MKIAIDCDGILANFTAGALRVVEKITSKRYRETDVDRFDFCKALALSYDETNRVKATITGAAGFCASLDVYRGASTGMRQLRELGDVHVVTSPWPGSATWQREREDWLYDHFGITADHVHHELDKSDFAADVFVDDHGPHVRAWLARWPGRIGVFWRTPHNTIETVPWPAWSIGSWDRLISIVEEEAVERARRGQERAFAGEAP